MNESFESLLDAARQLPPIQQKLLEQEPDSAAQLTESQQTALEAVEKLSGTIKGLDRETILWLAEDEELCGY